MPEVRLIVESASCLADYGSVPIAFEVRERLDLDGVEKLGTLSVRSPFTKDYDQIAGNRPIDWADRWDLRRWRFAGAFAGDERIGGIALAMDAADVEGPSAPSSTVLIWDLRVHPAHRRRGVGRRLLAFAEEHARAAGVAAVRVETQDINVPACRFYARAGYTFVEMNRHAYAKCPDEVQLIWQKELG